MALVAVFDTQIAIYGIQENVSEDTASLRDRAKALIEECKSRKMRLVLPSVVVGEYLVRIPENQHTDVLRALSETFELPSYDVAAAAWAARIRAEWRRVHKLGQLTELKRREVAIDCQVIGTAINRKATYIYAFDDDIIKLGKLDIVKRRVEVCLMPEIALQLDLSMDAQRNGTGHEEDTTAYEDTSIDSMIEEMREPENVED